MNWKKTLLLCIVILIVAGAVTAFIFMTEPTAQREGATKETAMLVEVTSVEYGNFHPTIVATGVVEAEKDIVLSPRVNGEIEWIASGFTPGETVRKGAALLRIDPADYQNALAMRKATLQQTISDLELEKGRQFVAERDYQLFNDTLPEDNKALVLREPQLKAAQSMVESARIAVAQAELDLERTTIRAPFDAQIISRNANVGSQVSVGEDLGRLVGIEEYWVAVSVPMSQLQWLTFPGNGKTGSEVRIRSRTAWDKDVFRTGQIDKLVGALDVQTRLATVLVSVRDPLAQRRENRDLPPLIISAFVEVHITADEIADVIRLSRDYVRKDDKVWVMEEGRLRIKSPDILFRDEKYAYIRSGLDRDDRIVVTNLSTVTEGARLRLENADPASGQDSMEGETHIQGTQPTGGTQ